MSYTFPLSIPFAPTGTVTQAALDAKFTQAINDLAALASFGYLIEANDTGSTTLAATATAMTGPAIAGSFTLPSQRRVRIVTSARFQMASGTSGRYQLVSAYNLGGTVDIPNRQSVGLGATTVLTVTGTNGSASLQQEGTVVLAAGTYTAWPNVARLAGGSTTDVATSFYVAVFDIGSV